MHTQCLRPRAFTHAVCTHTHVQIGRNGTGKTTFLRALAGGDIKGLPPNCQVSAAALATFSNQ